MPPILAFVCVLSTIAPATSGGTSGTAAGITRAADALERFDAVDIAGERWTRQDMRGRVVLIDFWATWCAPCLADLPKLQGLRAKYSSSDFEIIGVSLDAIDRRSFVSWLNRQRVDWPQVHERGGYNGRIARLFEIDRLPRTILIDRDGSIAAVDLRGEMLAQAVDRLVAGAPARAVRQAGPRVSGARRWN